MDKSFLEALKKVKGKQLDEAMTVPGTKPNPDPKNLGFFSTNNQSPYGFAKSGSDEDSAANFFASDKRMRDAQAAAQQTQQAAPVQRPKPRPAPVPLPPRVPREGTSGPNQSGSARPVPSNPSDPAQNARADEIARQDAQRAAGASVADQRAAGENVQASPRNISTGLDSKNTGNVQADQSRADVQSGKDTSILGRVMNWATGGSSPSSSSAAPAAAPAAAPTPATPPAGSSSRGTLRQSNALDSIESESGKKKKMSESMIDAFLKLQSSGASNMFEAAKKAKKDWDKDGKIESDKDEVWGSRFAAAKKAGKMEEELKGNQDKIDANHNGKIDGQDFKLLRGKKKMEEGVDTSPIKKSTTSDPDFAAPSANPDAPKSPITFKANTATTVAKSTNEEVSFSASELAHFEAVIARKDMKGKENALNPTVDSANLTDEYVVEMARGVKAGTKRGSYKKKATDLQGNKVAGADAATDESDKGIPHVLDQIRSAKEDEKGNITLKDHDSDPANPNTGTVHRKVARDFYSDYHNTEKPADKNAKLADFKSKVFG